MNLYELKELVQQSATVRQCERCVAVRTVVCEQCARQCAAVLLVVYGSAHGSVQLSDSAAVCSIGRQCPAVRQCVCSSAAVCGSVRQCVSACVVLRQCATVRAAMCGSVWQYVAVRMVVCGSTLYLYIHKVAYNIYVYIGMPF
jgi:hypothetical protein